MTVLKRLGPDDLVPISSPYLSGGRRDESWTIDWVEIGEDKLQAAVLINSPYISASDAGGFHVTIFSALEVVSQLLIVYMHVWAGLEEKVREVWMVESQTRSIEAIRDRTISVEMQATKMRKVGARIYSTVQFRVKGSSGGLFEISLKCFLS